MKNMDKNKILEEVNCILKKEGRALNVNELLDLMNEGKDSSKLVTRGQILNIQTKVKNNKIKNLKLIYDDNKHYKITSNTAVEEMENIIELQFSIIDDNITLLKDRLTSNDRELILEKLKKESSIFKEKLNESEY